MNELIFLSTIVIICLASIVNGHKLEFIEGGKICTGWQSVSSVSVEVDTTLCSSSLDYEIKMYMSAYVVRFCCTYRPMPESNIESKPNECGRQTVSPIRTRIVGGQEAIPHSWPWLVSLQINGHHFCGGTLIDEYHVLTAAHCLQDEEMFGSGLTVVAGLHKRSQPNQQQIQRRQVSRIVNHGGYNEITNDNDIAIIRLTTPVKLNSFVNIACLPGKDPSLNENVVIAGWGTTSFGGSPPDALRQATINVMNYCPYVYDFDERKQICAGNSQYTKDSCQGDSGGPLMYEVNGQWTVSGVVSYGDECAKKDRPGVYTRISYYMPWIRSVISSLSGK